MLALLHSRAAVTTTKSVISINIGAVAYGLAAIGPGVGIGLVFAGASFVMTVVLTGFEMLIQALQAYIFTILTAQYIGGAYEAAH